MDKWICTECGESEGGDIHCEAKVEIGKPEFCLISGDEAEWHLVEVARRELGFKGPLSQMHKQVIESDIKYVMTGE